MLTFAASLFLLAANTTDSSQTQKFDLEQVVVGEEDELQVFGSDELVLDDSCSESDLDHDLMELED